MELKVIVADGSLAEHRLAPETIMDEVQAALTRMNVNATLLLVEEDPVPAGYGEGNTETDEPKRVARTQLLQDGIKGLEKRIPGDFLGDPARNPVMARKLGYNDAVKDVLALIDGLTSSKA